MIRRRISIPSRSSLLAVLWALVFVAVPVWMHFDRPGWDLGVYTRAVRAVAAHHDPYADAIAIQKYFHQMKLVEPGADPPYSYVYSPITLPLLRAIGHIPRTAAIFGYLALYIAGILAEIWVAMLAVEDSERPCFLFLAPIAPFFPGLLANGVILGGNVAYILYAAMLLAAVYGWKRGSWRWFYLATLAASCAKAPLLSLLLLPVLSARKQWIPAGITAAVGAGLFVMQPLVWPALFKEYLEAVDLQFRYNRDFGCSPAGIFSGYLYDRGISYNPASIIFFLLYAIPLAGLLFYLSRQYLRGAFSWKQWFPVLLTGIILLNPRLIEYDTAPIALLLALIGWRFLRSRLDAKPSVVVFLVLFLVGNIAAVRSWSLRLLIDGPLLVLFFLAGSWTLLHQTSAYPAATATEPALSTELDDDLALASGG